MRKVPLRIRKCSTKLHIKVRVNLWKALFKKRLERNCKSKNVLEFDEEKDGRIIFGNTKKNFK